MVEVGGTSVRDWHILKQNVLFVEVDFFTSKTEFSTVDSKLTLLVIVKVNQDYNKICFIYVGPYFTMIKCDNILLIL